MKNEFPGFLCDDHYDDGTVILRFPLSDLPPRLVEGPGGKPFEEPSSEVSKPTYKQLTCKRCDYTWTPRKKQKPVQCPRCFRHSRTAQFRH